MTGHDLTGHDVAAESDQSPRDPWVTGALLTSSELEGVAAASEWSRWIDRGRAPKSNDGNGFRTTWRDDLAAIGELGLSEVAVTLEWSRLTPEQDAHDQREIEFRRDLLSEIRSLGMEPWACLVDGSVPGWFAEDERGFTDDRSRNLLWPRHVDWIGETFGDLVAGWIPQREPVQWALWGNLIGAVPPGNQRRRDAGDAVAAALDADLLAWRLLQGSAPVATYQTARSIRARRDDVKAARHADWLDDTFHRRWLESLDDGDAREAFDRVIVQLRPVIVVDGEGNWSGDSTGSPTSSMIDALLRVRDHSGDRIVMGAGDAGAFDGAGGDRAERLTGVINDVRATGSDGWWQTSPIDGWHWQHGFTLEPGLFDADRTARDEALAFMEAFGRLPPSS